MERLDRFKKAVEYLKTKADEATNEGVSRLLRYSAENYISDVIGESKPINKQLIKRMVEFSINDEWIQTGKGKMIIDNQSEEHHLIPKRLLIEIKTASGKIIEVNPDGKTDIPLLNAFLEERDRVLDERNRTIEKIETQTQARIEELKKDKEALTQKLNSILEQIYGGQQLALAYQKAWVDYEAEKMSKGDQNKKKELMYKMGKLVDGMIQNDESKGIPAETDRLRKEGQ